MQPSLSSRLVAAATVPLTLALLALPGLSQGGASAEPLSDAVEAQRVFPAERPSQDARLSRLAHTTDTPVRWAPDPDPVRWMERVEELKARMRVALGLWPHPSAGLEHLTTGVIDCGDYVIEKRTFMSWWFNFPAANLYLPKAVYDGTATELAPMVVIPCGEWDGGRLRLRSEEEAQGLIEKREERELANARRPYQALAAQLARMGCVTLLYDVTASGESNELTAGDFVSAGRLGRAQNLLGWRVWDGFNALNQVWNLETVDSERVAMIGNGAGAQLPILLALQEPRIKTLVALNYLSRKNQGDSPGETAAHLHIGTSNLEYAAALAPRALYLASTGPDACARQAEFGPLLEEQWELRGAPDALQLACYPEDEQGLNVHVREGVYDFLNKELSLGFSGPIEERAIEPLATRDLAVHEIGGRSRHDYEQPKAEVFKTLDSLTARANDLIIHEETEYRVQLFKQWIGAALSALLATELPPAGEVTSRLVGYERREDRAVMRMTLGRAGAGEEVPAILVMPDRWNHSVVVGVSGGGKADFFGAGDAQGSLSAAARVVDLGAAFLAIDPMLTGEFQNVAPDASRAPALPVDRQRHDQLVAFTYDYNRTLIGERVHDVLTAIAFAHSLADVEQVNLVGSGKGGTWALLARALAGEETVARTAAQWTTEFVKLDSVDDPDFLPGGVRYGDMAFFTTLITPAELCLVGEPGQGPIGVPEHVMRAYSALEKKARVRSAGSTEYPAVIDWLAGSLQ